MLTFKQNQTPTGQARMLARHYPTGRVWANVFKASSNMGKVVLALAQTWLRTETFAARVMTELDINKTEELLSRWEESVGIPDAMFQNTGSLELRRLQVLQRLIDFGGAQTLQDFIDIAELFGFTGVRIIVSGSGRVFPLSFPLAFSTGDGSAVKSTIYVTLPNSTYIFALPFPLLFSATSGLVLEAIFRALIPANVAIEFTFGEAP